MQVPEINGVGLAFPPEDVPVPRVLLFLLTEVMGLEDRGSNEKTAWEVDFEYQGVLVTLAHRKFGVRLEIWNGDPNDIDAANLGQSLIRKLQKAVKILDKVLAPIAVGQIRSGQLTIGNRYHQLRGHYEYFREVVDECLMGRGRWFVDGRANDRLFAREQEAFMNLTASVHAYFSWLEHVLVLALPFVDFDPAKDDLSEIIGSGWRDKYKRLFEVAVDPRANRLLDRLIQLSERIRNPWSHGAFDKSDGLLYVHMPTIGAVPTSVSEYGKNIHFTGVMGANVDFADVWKLLDETDDFLESSPRTSFGVRYAASGLQVMFDARSRAAYKTAMRSANDFEEFVIRQGEMEDMLTNMDW